jgi:hypothetical protein
MQLNKNLKGGDRCIAETTCNRKSELILSSRRSANGSAVGLLPGLSIVRCTGPALLNRALCALENTKTLLSTEVKTPTGNVIETSVAYNQDVLAVMRGLFGASKEYRFQMHFVSALSTTAGGALLGTLSLSPSVSSYAEWTALAGLFDEVKMYRSSVTFLSTNAPASATTAFEMPMTIAPNHVNLSTAPASTLAVVRLAESNSFNSTLCVKPYVQHAKYSDDERLWCLTGTPWSQSPLGGCIGTWDYGNHSVGGGSTQYFSVIVRAFVKLRCRA